MRLRSPFSTALLLLFAFVAPGAMAQDGLQGAVTKLGNASGLLRSSLRSALVPADFDNDKKPDGAVLLDAGVIAGQRMYRVELHLSAGENSNLLFAANDSALTVSAQDVNQDGAPDLIIEQAFSHKRLQVWLNDGHGRFSQARTEDFPAPTDAPGRYRAPMPSQASLVLGLPSRFETNRTVLLREILRFDSSSSHWRVRLETSPRNEFTFASDSPRAPPAFLPL